MSQHPIIPILRRHGLDVTTTPTVSIVSRSDAINQLVAELLQAVSEYFELLVRNSEESSSAVKSAVKPRMANSAVKSAVKPAVKPATIGSSVKPVVKPMIKPRSPVKVVPKTASPPRSPVRPAKKGYRDDDIITDKGRRPNGEEPIFEDVRVGDRVTAYHKGELVTGTVNDFEEEGVYIETDQVPPQDLYIEFGLVTLLN